MSVRCSYEWSQSAGSLHVTAAETKSRASLWISLPVSNVAATSRRAAGPLPTCLHTDCHCFNLPSHFLPPCCSRLKLEPQQQTRAFCPFGARAPPPLRLHACLPDSQGPMIDCSLSAFVLGNCFVLLTVCLCSSPDSRDSTLPFFTYLPNMFESALKWITVEYVKVKAAESHKFRASRWRKVCLCEENNMHTTQEKESLFCAVCPFWGLMIRFTFRK